MKKLLLLAVCSFCIVLGSYAQENKSIEKLKMGVDSLKNEVRLLKSDVGIIKGTIKSVQDENTYLRNVLKIGEPVKEFSNGDITIKLLKVEGNRGDKSVTFRFLLYNNGEEHLLYIDMNDIVDAEGNGYKVDSHLFGTETIYSFVKLYKNVPLKCSVTYKDIPPTEKIIKIMRLTYQVEALGEKIHADFRDLNIDWV